VLYVLDEPSIGLHQRDNQKLIQALVSLRDLGNTVLVVEHDEDTIRHADHVIDLGPGAGRLAATSSPRAVRRTSSRSRLAHRAIPRRQRSASSRVSIPARPKWRQVDHRRRRAQPQSAEPDRALPSRRHDGGHRRLRFRQIHAGQ
jgi:excinuclease ABC subunit A